MTRPRDLPIPVSLITELPETTCQLATVRDKAATRRKARVVPMPACMGLAGLVDSRLVEWAGKVLEV